MRLTVAALLLSASLGGAAAFVPSAPSFPTARQRTGVLLGMAARGAEAPKQTKPASPAELLARARKNAGLPEDDDEPPKLFDDGMLDDFQQCLLKLEKRVKEGPGCLTAEEVTEFEAATGRILDDMNEKLKGGGAAPAAGAAAAAPPNPPAATAAPAVKARRTAPLPPDDADAGGEEEVVDKSLDEGPAYKGEGGLGLASGTRNTWVIPGMEEMSAEEYQDALQRSVIERQERRRKANRGVVGNRAGHGYLDSLGWGGATSSLAAEDEEGKGRDFESRPELYDA